MPKKIDYYLSPSSPWAYLGHQRFIEIARRHGAEIALKPVDYGRIFPATGGLPLKQRAPARQAYRMMELRRWRSRLGVELVLEPKFTPVDAAPAARLIIAAMRERRDGLALAAAIMRALWAEDRDIADKATLTAIATAQGHDPDRLLAVAADPATEATYTRYTEEALAAGVFGAPTYVYEGELFWGQDRLDFVDSALAR
jgi:2-hydroxychromene-2-carboxylate isomerase